MKKITIWIVLMMMYVAGFAQENSTCSQGYIGIRGLGTLSAVDVHEQNNGNVKSTFVTGYGFGVYGGYNFNTHIGVQAELLYSSLSQKFTANDVTQRLDLKYVNIPLLLSLNTNSCGKINFNIVAGPQIGINVGSSLKTEGGSNTDTVQAVLAVKPGDLGLAYGAGFDFELTPALHLGVGFRGVYGIIDISNNNNNATTNQYYILDRSKVKTYSGYVSLGVSF